MMGAHCSTIHVLAFESMHSRLKFSLPELPLLLGQVWVVQEKELGTFCWLMQMLHFQSNCQWSLCLTLLVCTKISSTPLYTPVESCLSQQRHCAAPEEARKFIWPLSSGLGQSCSEDRTFFFPFEVTGMAMIALTIDLGCVVLNLANLRCSFWAGRGQFVGHCRSPELNTADTGPESSWAGDVGIKWSKCALTEPGQDVRHIIY